MFLTLALLLAAQNSPAPHPPASIGLEPLCGETATAQVDGLTYLLGYDCSGPEGVLWASSAELPALAREQYRDRVCPGPEWRKARPATRALIDAVCRACWKEGPDCDALRAATEPGTVVTFRQRAEVAEAIICPNGVNDWDEKSGPHCD